MARGPLTFRQQDVVRALKSVRAAGIEVTRVEIDKTGKIVMVTSKASTELPELENPWDEVRHETP